MACLGNLLSDVDAHQHLYIKNGPAECVNEREASSPTYLLTCRIPQSFGIVLACAKRVFGLR